jgi:hypothetical protein
MNTDETQIKNNVRFIRENPCQSVAEKILRRKLHPRQTAIRSLFSAGNLRARISIDGQQDFCRNRRMMKTRIAAVAVALSFIATAACFAANPHIGTWKLNEAKSKPVPGMGKNTTVTYTEQKDKIKVTVEGVDKDGKPTHSVWSASSMEKPTR